jgi:hypothetical protein
VTSIVDTTSYINRDVSYRVAGRYKNGTLTNWKSGSASAPSTVLCGLGEVTDLGATARCGDSVLAWSAATNASWYDVQASENGGSFTTIATNVAATTYTDSTNRNGGVTVDYQVRPASATIAGTSWSNIASVADWGFYVTSIVFGNGNGTLGAGDTITVTYNRGADTTTPNGTGATSTYIRRTGAKGVGISADATGAGGAAIGFIPTSTALGPSNTMYSGSAAYSLGNTVWTWTKGSGSVASTTSPGFGAYQVGTSVSNPERVKCSDTTSPLLTPDTAPTITGSF